VSTHVDDVLVTGFDGVVSPVLRAVDKAWKQDKMKMLGHEVGKEFTHLGLQIRRTRDGGVHVYQGKYSQQLVSEWGLSGCNPVPTPMTEDGEPVPETGEGAEQLEVQPSADDVQQAQKATGGLLWLSTKTRVDIAFVVSRLAQFATRAPL
jgi:hypothetical protein